MFNKLKCLFSFNWFYIIFFIVLSLYTFWDEISIGFETVKVMKSSSNNHEECSTIKDNKVSFMDIDNLSEDDEIITYNGDIKYIYFRPYIDKNEINSYIKGRKVHNSFITLDEFKKSLEVLYKNGYILVDIFDVYKQIYKGGQFRVQRQELKIPSGKVPFVLFLDDFGYKKSKLIISEEDSKIKFVDYKNGSYELIEDSNVITILNDFIEEHEDFSFNNARAVISLLDCESVFGYNTGKNVKKTDKNSNKIKKLSNDIYDAKKIGDKLKKDGWRFACNTYSNIDFKNVTLDMVKSDMENWFRYVSNIIGYTNLFVYPTDSVIDKDDERFRYLNDNGFNIFCSAIKGNNRDSFKIEDYINISRDLICYNTINSKDKEYFSMFKNIIRSSRKIKK